MLAKLGAESKQSFPGGNVFSQSLRQLHNYLVDRFRFRLVVVVLLVLNVLACLLLLDDNRLCSFGINGTRQ